MRYLIILLTTLTASAQLAITKLQMPTNSTALLSISWTNANPTYPLLFLASADITVPASNWILISSNGVPSSYGKGNFNYYNITANHIFYLGIHDSIFTVTTNSQDAGYVTQYVYANPTDPNSAITGTNIVWQAATNTYTTNFNCFFRLYQPIPPPLPPDLNSQDIKTAIQTVLGNSIYQADFGYGLGFGFTVTVGSFAISYLRSVLHSDDI
jgi:hypothetical protein